MDARRLAQRLNLLGPWLRERLGGPTAKVVLDAGLGCPNRDGTISRGGCSFCPPHGAGRGQGHLPLAQQLDQGLQRLARRGRPVAALAYFQAFSSTHGPAPHLAELYEQALDRPEIRGLVISTRPDCLDGPRWEVLADLSRRSLLWLELGLQSAHDSTLAALGRGHDVACFDRAVSEAHKRGIMVVAHVILGLPGEDMAHTAATAEHLARLGVWGVKLHNLMVLQGARLADDYRAGRLELWSRRQWAEAAADFVARLPASTVLHRLAADPGPDHLLAPAWATGKQANLAALAQALEEADLEQGKLCP